MGNPLTQLRNSQKENLQVKAGETPIEWNQQENKSVLIKKDFDADGRKKNKENYYSYKSHINDDQRHKLIQNYKVTTASFHYSQALEELLDHEISRDEIIFSAPSSYGSTLRSNNRNDESGLHI